MTEAGKKGSSRRKGDEYQDLTALRFALESYIANVPFKMLLEYEEAGNLDDIVVTRGAKIEAYQVKYAVNPLAVYGPADFTDRDSRVYLKKFADSWNKVRERFPNHSLAVYLCSNRGLDSAILKLVSSDGSFGLDVIKDRKRGDAKTLRSELELASGLNSDSFRKFLTDFQFRVRQPTLTDLEQHIRTVLLDKELGIPDAAIFLDLKEAFKQHAIDSRDAIDIEFIDKLLERFKGKLLIPQVFPVNQDHFVERRALSIQLDNVLSQVDGEYILVTGLPGSGKSTSLTSYFNAIDRAKYEVFRYYCFVTVNDNVQKTRVRAESLREILLREFHRRYPDVLERRYNYSEQNFLECLKALAKNFTNQGRRLVIFLDGLDHAERFETEVSENVISALPADVPEGIVIVLGTQELHKWPHFLKRTRERPETHIQMPLFTKAETREYLVNKRGMASLSDSAIADIYTKSEGLPLYLQYAAEIILSGDESLDTVATLAPATGGDIRNYYELLWEEIDRIGMKNARHMCGVMGCLRFAVHRDELFSIQKLFDRPTFDDAYKCISHLLRDSDDRVGIFHNSFREFTISQLDSGWIEDIRANIAAFLKASKDSPKWFEYVFEYCYEVSDYDYILKNVDNDFVDRSLLHFRPSMETMSAIQWAAKSAYEMKDIVQLSRLGPLQFRSGERLEHYLDRDLLADVLLDLGREQDVMSFSFLPEADRWIVKKSTALNVIYALAEKGHLELGRKLFEIFMDEFAGIQSDDEDERDDTVSQIIGLARCKGIYSENQADSLRWLSRIEFTPSILEPTDSYAPGYAPHLAAYIDTLVQFEHTSEWTRLKRIRKLFSNSLVRYLLIRALAHHNLIDELRTAVAEYVEQEHPDGNLELAFYAAKAGARLSEVTKIAGLIRFPNIDRPERLNLLSDPVLMHYAYSFAILSYEANESSYRSLSETIGTSQTLWNSALRHLLKSCHCIGRSFRNESHDWYPEACESVDILIQAERGDGERIIELINLLRSTLQFTIGSLTEEIQKHFPERIDKWIEKLGSLRDSFLWKTHFGAGEYVEDYNFELGLWETLAREPVVSTKLAPILESCASTYKESTLLKGHTRSSHFLRLAAVMAKCGMRNDAEKWLTYGIRSSLIYGYRKDATLSYLIDVMRQVNQHHPETALERCARVLQMVKWMPHLTDGRRTKHFTKEAFSAVLDVDRKAALEFLKHISQNEARWKMEECLEKFLLGATDEDLEYLWCLSESFTDQNATAKVRQHIVNLAKKSCPEDIQRAFENRFRHFVLTEVSPSHWPDNLKSEFSVPLSPESDREDESSMVDHGPSSFLLDGESVSIEYLVEQLGLSFSESLATLKKLKEQNERFSDYDFRDAMLEHHISVANSAKALDEIKEYLETLGRWQNPHFFGCLGERFLSFGDQANAIECFGKAYTRFYDYTPWQTNAKYLEAIAKKDQESAEKFLLRQCFDTLEGNRSYYGGIDTPPFAAAGLDILEKPLELEKVFNVFLAHCESMFAQLPLDDSYAWLKEYSYPEFDESEHILQFSLKDLCTKEIDLGKRLIRALTKLAIERPQSAIPILMNRALTASGRVLRRLLAILQVIAAHRPDLLVSHQKELAAFLAEENFLCRQSAVYILGCVNEVSPLHPHVATAVQRIERRYSSSEFHSTYRMQATPSAEFTNFLAQNTLFTFSGQIRIIESLLRVRSGSLVAALEEQLSAQNWALSEERARVRQDWDGHVHPQDWPVVWITTEFQELATEALWKILDEAATKMKLNRDQIHWLRRITQVVDSENVVRGVMTRPLDIKMLCVNDREEWFSELSAIESLQVGGTATEGQRNDWITAFEMRNLAQEEKHHVHYRQDTLIQGTLIPIQLYGGSQAVDELELRTEPILPNSALSITWEQARDVLTVRGKEYLELGEDCLPLIAMHQNPPSFLGYFGVCTLTSFIINEFSLSFNGFDLSREGKIVAKYEAWEEGYQDEQYTREKLSLGMRLRIRRDFLAEVCRRYGRMLCIRVDEDRKFYKSNNSKEPDARRESYRYVLYHL